MPEVTKIYDFLEQARLTPVVDVRSPSEFSQGHIPGAFNIPLFTDEERKTVGILYKKSGRKEAIKKGFKILASKFSILINDYLSLAEEGRIMLYCWRGGMRSGAVGWLLERYGMQVTVLDKGYKSFRQLIRNYFSNDLKLYILGGMTGSGKTEMLSELQKKGHQAIDLESIANHKGSAFGALGEDHQPTNEQFENDLLFEFLKLDKRNIIWLENESRSIGKVIIPDELYRQMKESHIFNIEIPLTLRIDRLVNEYSRFCKDDLIECIQKIKKKIGGKDLLEAQKALEVNNYHKFAAITLRYYDKTYNYSLQQRIPERIIQMHSQSSSPSENVILIEKYLEQHEF